MASSSRKKGQSYFGIKTSTFFMPSERKKLINEYKLLFLSFLSFTRSPRLQAGAWFCFSHVLIELSGLLSCNFPFFFSLHVLKIEIWIIRHEWEQWRNMKFHYRDLSLRDAIKSIFKTEAMEKLKKIECFEPSGEVSNNSIQPPNSSSRRSDSVWA